MPCTYTGSLEGDRLLAAKEALDQRERYLCAVVRQLQRDVISVEDFLQRAAENADGIERSEILNWWDAHRAADLAQQ